MTETEKYTLPQVLEIVRGHAQALEGAGAALKATEGKDPEMLTMVGERAQRAKEELWKFESDGVLDDATEAAWTAKRGENEVGYAMWQTLYALPLLVMAVEACAANPTGVLPSGDRFFWLHYEAERIAGVLTAWVAAHEKGAESASTTEETTDGTVPSSQPEEPQEPEEAFRRDQEAARRRRRPLQGPGGPTAAEDHGRQRNPFYTRILVIRRVTKSPIVLRISHASRSKRMIHSGHLRSHMGSRP